MHWFWSTESKRATARHDPVEETDLSYQRQGQQALQKALEIARDTEGWRMEMSEVSLSFTDLLQSASTDTQSSLSYYCSGLLSQLQTWSE